MKCKQIVDPVTMPPASAGAFCGAVIPRVDRVMNIPLPSDARIHQCSDLEASFKPPAMRASAPSFVPFSGPGLSLEQPLADTRCTAHGDTCAILGPYLLSAPVAVAPAVEAFNSSLVVGAIVEAAPLAHGISRCIAGCLVRVATLLDQCDVCNSGVDHCGVFPGLASTNDEYDNAASGSDNDDDDHIDIILASLSRIREAAASVEPVSINPVAIVQNLVGSIHTAPGLPAVPFIHEVDTGPLEYFCDRVPIHRVIAALVRLHHACTREVEPSPCPAANFTPNRYALVSAPGDAGCLCCSRNIKQGNRCYALVEPSATVGHRFFLCFGCNSEDTRKGKGKGKHKKR